MGDDLPWHRDRARRRRGSRARPSSAACPCARRAGRRCPSSRSAMRRRLSASLMKCSVCMLCRRSASLTSSTRMSSDMASTSLRKFSACLVWSDCSSMRDSLVTPSTRRAISLPNSCSICSERRVRVLDRVVQQAGDDRGAVELHARQELGDVERMGEIGIARGPALRAMRLHGEDIGAVERVLIGRGIIGLYPLDQFELPNHAVTSSRPPRQGRIPWRAAR